MGNSSNSNCRVCAHPFNKINIVPDGTVWTCCEGHIDFPLGNIFETPFEEIWYGEAAREIRRMVLAGDYSCCNMRECNMLMCDLRPEWTETPPFPEVVFLSQSYECNIRCMMCRRKLMVDSAEELAKLNAHADRLMSCLKNAKTVCMNASGDPLAGRHCNMLMKRIVAEYPDIRFILHTNGQLFTKEKLEQLGIYDKVAEVYISVHAATRETYEKVCIGAKWERLIPALELAQRMKAEGRIKRFLMFFTLSHANYTELPAFVEFAKSCGASAGTWIYRNWGVQDAWEASELMVYNSSHRDYWKLVDVLRDVIRRYPNDIELQPLMYDIANSERFVCKL